MTRAIAPWILATSLAGGCVERGTVLAPASEEEDAATGSAGADAAAAAGTASTEAGATGAGGSSGADAETAEFVGLGAGEQHACAIAGGSLYCWGANGSGRLGLGDEADRSRPVRVVGDVQWTSVAAGSGHSCGLDEAGTVYCWGDNRRGQLGQGDRAARSLPSPVMLPRSATSISASFDHSCAVLLDATLYCWGSNGEGELGQADALAGEDQSAADALEPIRVPLDDVRSIDNGQGHTCAIRLDGALFCWGRNSSHELGPETRIQVREPLRIGSDGDWLVVDAGQNHTCALKEDRSAWCWGENVGSIDYEGSPLGLEADIVDEPTRIADVAFRELATDTFHTCALSADDELSCWGRNVEGQLGLGDLDLRRAPARVDAGYASIGLSRFGTCAIARSGELRCTGKNDVGELGVGDAERRNRLTPVAFP